MLRPLAALLLFALPLLAAPVPKALKKPTAPPLADTTWKGANIATNGPLDVAGEYEYTFHAGGQFTANQNGRFYSKGTWTQDGETVEWEFNSRYAVYTVAFKDGKYEGSGSNVTGKSWGVTLTPKEK